MKERGREGEREEEVEEEDKKRVREGESRRERGREMKRMREREKMREKEERERERERERGEHTQDRHFPRDIVQKEKPRRFGRNITREIVRPGVTPCEHPFPMNGSCRDSGEYLSEERESEGERERGGEGGRVTGSVHDVSLLSLLSDVSSLCVRVHLP